MQFQPNTADRSSRKRTLTIRDELRALQLNSEHTNLCWWSVRSLELLIKDAVMSAGARKPVDITVPAELMDSPEITDTPLNCFSPSVTSQDSTGFIGWVSANQNLPGC